MKKLLVAILSVLYLTTSIGATVHMHYCMDRLVNIGLQKTNDQLCGHCGMKKESTTGCCKDEHKQVKLQTDQKVVESFVFNLHSFSDVVLIPFVECHSPIAEAYCHRLPYGNAPPEQKKIGLYLRNCVFRI